MSLHSYSTSIAPPLPDSYHHVNELGVIMPTKEHINTEVPLEIRQELKTRPYNCVFFIKASHIRPRAVYHRLMTKLDEDYFFRICGFSIRNIDLINPPGVVKMRIFEIPTFEVPVDETETDTVVFGVQFDYLKPTRETFYTDFADMCHRFGLLITDDNHIGYDMQVTIQDPMSDETRKCFISILK